MQSPVPKEELVIRTMKDDMAQKHSISVVSPIAKEQTSQKNASFEVFPLPSKQEGKVAIEPKRGKKNIFIGSLYVTLFLALTVAGWYGYMWWASQQQVPVATNETRPVAEMIPKEAMAVVVYDLDSESKRTGIKLLWDIKGIEVSGNAFDGDPRELLAVQDVSQIYYVALQDNPRPFLLIQKTPLLEQYVATQSAVVPLEKDGWYILGNVGMEQYLAALTRGTLAENGSLQPLRSQSAVAQYIFAAPYASKLFNDIASDALGISRIKATTFEVDAPSQDGTIRARAVTPVSPVPEKLAPSLTELKELVPGDVEFGHVGFDFAEDMAVFQQETSRLDGNIVEQPAVRQFISLLNTPYALFKRTGSDGVRDIGLILQLPESLQKNLKTGEPIVEQSLPAMIPLILGKTVGIQTAFHDGTYSGAINRYVNIDGQTQGLNYLIGDNYILISSSREGMQVLIDRAVGQGSALQSKNPWNALFEKAAALLEGKSLSLGSIQDQLLLSLIPTPANLLKIPVALSIEITSTDRILHATLLVQQ